MLCVLVFTSVAIELIILELTAKGFQLCIVPDDPCVEYSFFASDCRLSVPLFL